MGVRGFGFLELCVGNARQAAAFFSTMYGFEIVGTAGPSASGHEVSYVLEQGDATLVVTGAADATSSAADFVRIHGDGVRDIALVVGDVADTHDRAVTAGARSLQGPAANERGVTTAVLGGFGDLTHTLLSPDADPGDVIDGYQPLTSPRRMAPAVGITGIDHYAVSVTGGDRERWTRHYCDALGMVHNSADEHVNVEGSAFSMSTVHLPSGGALVLAEPTPSQRKSQITGFLESFGGPGVHHIAFATDDIGMTARELRDRGIQTLTVPGTYHEEAPTRLRDVDVPWKELAELGVLVDTDARGHLLQAFTEPLGDRPTTYLEIIQREGMAGFGTANVRHLYSEVLRERALLGID